MKLKKENLEKFNLEKFNFLKKIKKFSYNLDKLVAIDPSDFDNIFILEDKIIKKIENNKIPKDALISTYIPTKYITTYELKVAKNLIDKIDINDYIETKSYEELELDEAEEYIFKYNLVNPLGDDKNILIEVSIIKKLELEEIFKPVFDKYKYIDYIGYSGFLFEVLYKDNIIEPKKDIFVYFKKNTILITLYNEGSFLQTIVLNEGLETLYKMFKEESSVEIENLTSYEIFVELITKKGLDINNYDSNEEILFNELSETFSNLFMLITSQITSLQRKFALPSIDRLFISTQNGPVPGILDFTSVYLGGVETNELKFDTHYNPNNIQIDQLLFLSMLSSRYAYKNDYQNFNFTIIKRPPTFFYRKSGQLISISVASLIISLLYPTYQYISYINKSHENHKLEKKLNNLNSQYRTLKHKFDKLLSAEKSVKKKVNNEKRYIENIQNIIVTLYKAKNSYMPISYLFDNIAMYMRINHIYAQHIKLKRGILKLNIFSKNEKNITNFVNDLVKKESFVVTTKGISKDKDNNNYVSIIEIKVGDYE